MAISPVEAARRAVEYRKSLIEKAITQIDDLLSSGSRVFVYNFSYLTDQEKQQIRDDYTEQGWKIEEIVESKSHNHEWKFSIDDPD